MNKTKGAILLTLAMVMTALVLPVIVSSSPFGVSKETVPDPMATYNFGDPIDYSIRLWNPSPAFNATMRVWDIFPNGTVLYWDGMNTFVYPDPFNEDDDLDSLPFVDYDPSTAVSDPFPPLSEPIYWNFKTTVADDWDPDNNGLITNAVRLKGFDDNPDIPGGDMIDISVTRSSELIEEPPEVPVLTPLGMITLLGLLLGIAVIALRKRQ